MTTAQPTPAPSSGAAAHWYIVHAYSGFEKKVAEAIREQAALKGLTDQFEEIVVPTEEIQEMKRGKKVSAERKFFPGYVLVKMHLTDASWHLVRTIPRVAGFLGGGGKPRPIPQREVDAIFRQVQEGMAVAVTGARFEAGEQVKVVDGPFESFTGVVDEVDGDRQRLKVFVTIFGRATPVELDYSQVEKVE